MEREEQTENLFIAVTILLWDYYFTSWSFKSGKDNKEIFKIFNKSRTIALLCQEQINS